MRFHPAARPVLVGLLLASAMLGAADALVALWRNRMVAPHATVPLCLTAPFVVALTVLLPPSWLLALVLRLRRRSATCGDVVAGLAAVAVAATVVRLGDVLGVAWRDGGAGMAAVALPGVVGIAAAAVGWLCWRTVRVAMGAADARWIARCAVVAGLVQATALGGLVWQFRREGTGVIGDALASNLRRPEAAGATAATRVPARGAPDLVPENLLLITIDTLRADHFDAELMPHTSALGATGVAFAAAHAASSWTLPSLASLMTGLPVVHHGAGQPIGDDPLARSPLAARHATLATHLQRAGFATRAIVTNPYLGLGYGLGQGFAAFENVTMESEAVLTLRPTLGFWLLERAVPSLAIVDRGDAVTRRAARFLGARRDGERFFLWLHYVDPHAPYDGATRSFRDDLLAGGTSGDRLPRMAQLRAGEIRPSRAGRAALRAAYARAVHAVDAEVGAVLTLLDRHGLAARTLVVVTADHGEEFWEHGGVEHGHTLFAELVRVPLVMRCPGCAPVGVRIADTVGLEALAPTLLELLGVAAPARDGTTAAAPGFAALLRGAPFVARPVISENLLFAEDRIALRTGRYTYVVWANGKEELYDRAHDPGELRDLSARSPLLRRHRELLATLRQPPAADRWRDAAGTGVTAATRRALQALGYVD